MRDNGGLPLDAEYDDVLRVVTADRLLTNEEYADAATRAAAEEDARSAVESLMDRLKLGYNDLPIGLWLAGHPLSGGPVESHHFEFRARVRPTAGDVT